MQAYMRMHLVDGTTVDGSPEPTTAAELEAGKPVIADMVMGSGGWQLNMELSNGNWVVFPKQSVLYVEIVVEDK